MHVYNNPRDMRILEGFTTDLPMVVRHFRQEIDMCRGAVDPAMIDDYPDSVAAYISARFTAHGMADNLENAPQSLMAVDALTFH